MSIEIGIIEDQALTLDLRDLQEIEMVNQEDHLLRTTVQGHRNFLDLMTQILDQADLLSQELALNQLSQAIEVVVPLDVRNLKMQSLLLKLEDRN